MAPGPHSATPPSIIPAASEIIRGAGNPFFVEALRRVNSIRPAYRSLAELGGMRRLVSICA
jgi:hypothetical protein